MGRTGRAFAWLALAAAAPFLASGCGDDDLPSRLQPSPGQAIHAQAPSEPEPLDARFTSPWMQLEIYDPVIPAPPSPIIYAGPGEHTLNLGDRIELEFGYLEVTQIWPSTSERDASPTIRVVTHEGEVVVSQRPLITSGGSTGTSLPLIPGYDINVLLTNVADDGSSVTFYVANSCQDVAQLCDDLENNTELVCEMVCDGTIGNRLSNRHYEQVGNMIVEMPNSSYSQAAKLAAQNAVNCIDPNINTDRPILFRFYETEANSGCGLSSSAGVICTVTPDWQNDAMGNSTIVDAMAEFIAQGYCLSAHVDSPFQSQEHEQAHQASHTEVPALYAVATEGIAKRAERNSYRVALVDGEFILEKNTRVCGPEGHHVEYPNGAQSDVTPYSPLTPTERASMACALGDVFEWYTTVHGIEDPEAELVAYAQTLTDSYTTHTPPLDPFVEGGPFPDGCVRLFEDLVFPALGEDLELFAFMHQKYGVTDDVTSYACPPDMQR